MKRFLVTIKWEKDRGTMKEFVRCTWEGPHGPVHTFDDPEFHKGQFRRIAAENAAIARMVNMMSKEGEPFTELEVIRY